MQTMLFDFFGALLRNYMLARRNSRLPPVCCGNMLIQGILLARFSVEVLTVSTPWDSVVFPKEAPALEFGNQELDNIFEGLGKEGVCLKFISSAILFTSLLKSGRPLTKLKPSTSASATQVSSPSAT